jgi:hypothetical protein
MQDVRPMIMKKDVSGLVYAGVQAYMNIPDRYLSGYQ